MSNEAPPAGLRALLTLAWPVVLSRSAQAVVGFSDALMTAPLGEDAIAAVTTGATNVFALAILPMGLVFIVQSFASQLKGRGELPAAHRYAYYALALSAATGVLGLCALPFVDDALSLLSFEAPVTAAMGSYMSIRLLALFGIVGGEALGNWFGGLGDTHPHMRASLLTMVLNVALNWMLIEGHWGAPALGVEGAAWASVIASFAGFAYLTVRFAAVDGWRRPVGLAWGELRRMVRFGLPHGINWFFEFAAWAFFLNVVVGGLGTAALAATMVVVNINSISFMPAFGLSSAGAILVGQSIGAGDLDAVPRHVAMTAGVAAVWQGMVGILYVLIPGPILSLFDQDVAGTDAMLAIGVPMLMISAAWQLFDALAMSLGEALRGAGDTAWVLWARLVVAWALFTPGSWYLIRVLDAGPVNAIWCVVGYLAILAGLLLWRFRSGAWRSIDLTGGEPDVV